MPLFIFEDFVQVDHKNGDGTVRYDVDTSYATHALRTAIKSSTIPGTPWTWPSCQVEFRSNIYSWWKPANFTMLSGVNFLAARGPLHIYSTENWSGAGKWRNGSPDPTGIEVPAYLCPQLDFTGSNGLNFEGGWNIQGQKLLGPINQKPTTIPGTAALFSLVERVKKTPSTGMLYYDGSGGENTSNNCRLIRFNGSGFWTGPGLYFANSVIHSIRDSGWQMFNDHPSSRAIAATQNIVAGIDSPFYPNVPDPLYRNGYDADQRMCRTPIAGGALVFDNVEVHSMIRDTFPSPGNSAIAAPVLFQKVNQIDVRNSPWGSDGLSIVELKDFARLLSFSGVEFWNADRHNNSQPISAFFLNSCAYSPTNATEPVSGFKIETCVLNSPYTAVVRGVGNSAIRGLRFEVDNNIHQTSGILDLDIGYSGGVQSSCLDESVIYAQGRWIKVGGSLNQTVRIASPGQVTAQGSVNYRPW